MDAALLSELIGHLYDTVADAGLWPGMAARIAAAFESTSTVVKLHGARSRFALIENTPNLTVPEPLRDWAEFWHNADLWVDRSVAFGMNRIVTDEMLVTPEEQETSAFYREWLSYLQIHHMVGAVFPAGDGAVGVLGIHRPRAAGAYDDGDRRDVALLLPHLQRTLQLGQRVADADLTRSLSLATLDRLETGVAMLGAAGHLIHANGEAEAIIAENDAFALRGKRLVLRDGSLQDRLSAMMRSLAETVSGRPALAPPVLAVPRAGRPALTLALAPAPLRTTLSLPVSGEGPLMLLFIRDPERPTLRADYLRALFGLTPTEAAIAAELGAGRSLEAIAVRLGVGLGTIRWHIKTILSKTGTTRQVEAAALLARSVASLPERR